MNRRDPGEMVGAALILAWVIVMLILGGAAAMNHVIN